MKLVIKSDVFTNTSGNHVQIRQVKAETCVHEQVDVDHKGANQNYYFRKRKIFIRMEINPPNGVKPKMGGRKVRSGVYWQGAFMPKGVNQMGVKNALMYVW
jgi:hypothetical protein